MTRPDWDAVYHDCAAGPDARRNDLLLITRETLSLSLAALKQDAAEDYYHNVGAAIREIDATLTALDAKAIVASAESISHQIGEGDLPEPVKAYLHAAIARAFNP